MNKIQLLPRVIIICIAIFINYWSALTGQSSSVNYKEAIQLFESYKDPDHDLINGRLLMPPRIKTYGHPYLGADEFVTGDITINNRDFRDVELKYDILEQQVITEYSYEGMSKRPIILNNEFIQCFKINGKYFIYTELPGLEKRYFQEITGNTLKCYYYFYKRVEEKSEGRYLIRQIHPLKVSRFLLKGDECLHYKSNRTFLKIFEEKYKSDIKRYIKSRKLSVKMISDKEMESLLKYCEELIVNE